MLRTLAILFLAAGLLSACQDAPPPGEGGQRIFKIGTFEKRKIPFRMQDSINALRAAKGLKPVELSPELTAAALTHSKDMSVQNRAWHFGSDGSNPFERVARAGYTGQLVGEAISETFEDDVQTLAAWMEDENTRAAIMDPRADQMGIAWFQEPNGKIWWTLVLGQKAPEEVADDSSS